MSCCLSVHESSNKKCLSECIFGTQKDHLNFLFLASYLNSYFFICIPPVKVRYSGLFTFSPLAPPLDPDCVSQNSSLILQRMDLGECPRIHDLALRADFEAAQKLQDHFYDVRFILYLSQSGLGSFVQPLSLVQVDACDHLASFISDCDRKTEQAKKKLAETQEALSDEVRFGRRQL